MSQEKLLVNNLFFLGLGIAGFFWGFNRLRKKRKIENIPTSTIRGLAMGLGEVLGKTEKRNILISPFTKMPCVFYSYQIERYQSSGKSSHWVTIAKGGSYHIPFFVNDATGKVLVFPKDAEVIIPVKYEFSTRYGQSPASAMIEFMESHNISYKSFFGTYTLRFKEWYLLEKQPVYILGTAKPVKASELVEQYNSKLVKRLEELKNNPEQMKFFDLDKNGQVDMLEWDLALVKTEQKLLEEEMASVSANEKLEAFIEKGDASEIFIISDYSQKTLIQKLKNQAITGIFGGSVLALVMLWSLLTNFFNLK